MLMKGKLHEVAYLLALCLLMLSSLLPKLLIPTLPTAVMSAADAAAGGGMTRAEARPEKDAALSALGRYLLASLVVPFHNDYDL